MSDKKSPEIDKIYMTQVDFAKLIGVTQAMVSRMKKKGSLVCIPGRGIDALESKKIYEAKQGAFKMNQPNHAQAKIPSKKLVGGATNTPKTVAGESIVEVTLRGTVAQANLTEHKAKNEQLKHEQTSGALLPREEVENDFFELGRAIRDSLQNIPSKIAPLICSTLGVKINKSFDVEQIISDALRKELERLARTPAVLKPRKGQKNGGPLKS